MADESWEETIKQAGDRYNIAPEGEYEFTIEEAESATFSTGNEGIKVKLRVAEGPESGKSVKTVNVVRSPKAAGMFLDHLGAVGISPDTLLEERPTLDQIGPDAGRTPVEHEAVEVRRQADHELPRPERGRRARLHLRRVGRHRRRRRFLSRATRP
jgi:hypothetical protein